MNCPSCNWPLNQEIEENNILACEYCDSIIENTWTVVEAIWEQSPFLDIPTSFEVMKDYPSNDPKNPLKEEIFIKWIVRYEYDWGYFDRFCIKTKTWETFYIEEDDWLRTLSKFLSSHKADTDYTEYEAWQSIEISWISYFITESGYCTLDSMKGIFDQRILPNTQIYYLDIIAKDSSMRIEYLKESNLVYMFSSHKAWKKIKK